MDELEARIEALERAVTDGDHDLSELATAGETGERLAAVETELSELADRVAELEAATQALRGYAGNVRAVNRDVEKRADAALAKAESIESALVGDGADDGTDGPPERTQSESITSPRTNGGDAAPAHREPPTSAGGVDHRTGGIAEERYPDQSGQAGGEGGASQSGQAGDGGYSGQSGWETDAAHPDRSSGETGQDRCRACGQQTADHPGGTHRSDPDPDSPVDAGTRAGEPTDAALDSVFGVDETHENGDTSAFERIRKML